MTDSVRARLRINSNLDKLSENKLDEVDGFIAGLLEKGTSAPERVGSLESIWKGIGFEKIEDLEQEIRNVRTSVVRRST